MVSHAFTTPILRETTSLTPGQLAQISAHLLEIRTKSPGEMKSNRGGWHSIGNLFDAREHREFPEMKAAVTNALFRYIGEAFAYRGQAKLALTGWSVINRPGDYNSPHNHAVSLLSAALYIAIPADMRGGDIIFQDPRLNLNACETPSMQRSGIVPPWLNTCLNMRPAAGDILVFPSWLNHYVEPYQSDDPEAARIVVSINATVA